MTKIRWTEQALADIEAIEAYIERDSPAAAANMVARLISLADEIEDFPMAGRMVPEVGDPKLRERIHGNYRMVYRLVGDVAELLTVYHASQRFSLP